MTAEVAVLNRTAVALAADSAVTVSLPGDQPGAVRHKTYDTSNKLFSLSKYHPVGIMVYGNAGILRHPWELLIKSYRERLRDHWYGTVREHSFDFLEFVAGFLPHPEQDLHFSWSLSGYYASIVGQINNKVEQITEAEGTIGDRRVADVVAETIDSQFNDCLALDDLPGLTAEYVRALLDDQADTVEKAIVSSFAQLPLSADSLAKLRTIAGCLFSKDMFPETASGVVIAGFGEDESFPSICSFTTDGVAGGKLKYRQDNDWSISPDADATIMAFAQQEMVASFVQGVMLDYDSLVNSFLTHIFDVYPGILAGAVPGLAGQQQQALLAALKAHGSQMLGQFQQALVEYKQTQYVNPVLSAVRVLPKDKLAEMAESLVSLTSLKRQMSTDEETVGGPIDVAVISRGDGFVWIRRKHYFDASLNHQFFANYFRTSG